MPRQARLDAPGTLHHIIIRGIERRNIVSDRNDRDHLIGRLGDLTKETDTQVYAWSLMNNHAHLLVRSGPDGIANLMRRFLTGYAIRYNRRHGRYGHLFQNRYKSIVCDENSYFAELVRYIHLNPMRAGIVETVSELDRYKYSGHSVLMGKKKNDWQDRIHVLNWFGKTEKVAVHEYREFVKAGIDEGKRPDLVGGGLIRSIGGWADVKSLRRRGERLLADERILGSGAFVQQVINEADETIKKQLTADEKQEKIKAVIEKICKGKKVNELEIRAGGRRPQVCGARAEIVCTLVEECGISYADIAKHVGVSTSGVYRIMRRNGYKST